MAGTSAKYPDLRYLFMRGLIQHERSQRSRHYLKAAAECTSRAVVSLELSEEPVKTVKQARKLEGIGGETCLKLTKLETERNFSCLRPLGGRFVSSAAAILVALLDLTEHMMFKGHKPDKPVVLPEGKVKEMAEHYTEETFQHSRDEGFCPAWWRLEVLIKRGYVKRRSLKRAPVLQLLPLGKDLAQTLRDRVGLLPQTAATVPNLPSLSPVKLPDKLEFDDELNTGETTHHTEYIYLLQALDSNTPCIQMIKVQMGRLVLLVDIQEMGGERVGLGELCGLIERRGIVYRTKKLKTGDYSWLWRTRGRDITLPCLVERKRADDLAGTLKEGRFWSQVKRMAEWKSALFGDDQGVDCRLYYVLERRPEEYVVKCTDGCQGIGRCGNPTLQQLHMVIEDLKRHPELLVRETDSLETTVVLLASLTAELKEGIAEGRYDTLLQTALSENQTKTHLDRKPRGRKSSTENRGSSKERHKSNNTSENLGSARSEQTYEMETVKTKKDVKAEAVNRTENNAVRMKTEDLSFEAQIALAIEMSKREVPVETEDNKHTDADMNEGLTVERAVKKKTDLNMNFDEDVELKEENRTGSVLELEDEDEALRIAIENSKQDVYKQERNCQLVAPTFLDGKDDEGNVPFPLMQYHVSAGGSVIYPHTSGYRNIAEQNSYRPKMNRKRVASSGESSTVSSDLRSNLSSTVDCVNTHKDTYRPKLTRNRTTSHGVSSTVGSSNTNERISTVSRNPSVSTDKDSYRPKMNSNRTTSHGNPSVNMDNDSYRPKMRSNKTATSGVPSTVSRDVTSDRTSTFNRSHHVDTYRDNNDEKSQLGTRLDCGDIASRSRGADFDSYIPLCNRVESPATRLVTESSCSEKHLLESEAIVQCTIASDSSRRFLGKENVRRSCNTVTGTKYRPETLMKDRDNTQDSNTQTSINNAHKPTSVHDSYKPLSVHQSRHPAEAPSSYQVSRKHPTISSTSISTLSNPSCDLEMESTALESGKSKPKKIKLCFTPSASNTQPEVIKPQTTCGRKKKTTGRRNDEKTALTVSFNSPADITEDIVDSPNKYSCSVIETEDDNDNDDDLEILNHHHYRHKSRVNTRKVDSPDKFSCSVVEIGDDKNIDSVEQNTEAESPNKYSFNFAETVDDYDDDSAEQKTKTDNPNKYSCGGVEIDDDNDGDSAEQNARIDSPNKFSCSVVEMDDEHEDSENLIPHVQHPPQLNKDKALCPNSEDGNRSDEDLFPGCDDLGSPAAVIKDNSVDGGLDLLEDETDDDDDYDRSPVIAKLKDISFSVDRLKDNSVDELLERKTEDNDRSPYKHSPGISSLYDNSFSSECSGSQESLPDISGDAGSRIGEMSGRPYDEHSGTLKDGLMDTSHVIDGIMGTSSSPAKHCQTVRTTPGCSTTDSSGRHEMMTTNRCLSAKLGLTPVGVRPSFVLRHRNDSECSAESENSKRDLLRINKVDVNVDHTISGIVDSRNVAGTTKSPTKSEEKVRTIVSVLPHVSTEAARATLKTCGGDVELCVSVLLEAGPTGGETSSSCSNTENTGSSNAGTTGRETAGSSSNAGVVDLTDSQSQDY